MLEDKDLLFMIYDLSPKVWPLLSEMCHPNFPTIHFFQILEFIAKVVNPLVIATFVVVYWVVGLIQYRYPSF